jgi:hypothetical protein
MARKKKSELVNEAVDHWTQQIKAGIEFRKKYSTSAKWTDWRKMYRGQYADDIVPVNKIFSYGRMMIPKVYLRSPRVCVTATRPELVWHAQVVEAIDNMLIRITRLKQTIKRAITDTFLCGIGPIKLGYDSEFGYMPEQAIDEDGTTATQESTKDGEGRIEYKEYIQPGMPWAARVMPEHVIVPWGSSDPKSLPWIAHYILRPLEDVQQDQKYSNTGELKGTRIPNQDLMRAPTPSSKSPFDKDKAYAELYEIRDFKTGKIITICENEILLSAEDSLQTLDSLPWEFMIFNEDPEYFWPIPDVVNLVPQQQELNDTVTQSAMHRRIALIKFLYLQSQIEEAELQKFLSGVVGPGVAIKGDGPISNVILPMQPHVPPDLNNAKVGILQDMTEGLGFSPNQMGQFSPRHNTSAREAGIVESGFEERVDERRDIASDLLVDIVSKWNQYIFNFWTEKKVIQIVTPKGQPAWVEYTGDQLKGSYLLSIEPDSGIPVTRMLKYQMAKELFGLFNGDQLVDQIKLRQLMLRSYTPVDPTVEQLVAQMPEGSDPQAISGLRQPNPMMPGRGGQSGGKPGSSQGNPAELLQLMQGGK